MIIQIVKWPLASFSQRKIENASLALLQQGAIALMTKFYRGWLHFNVTNQVK